MVKLVSWNVNGIRAVSKKKVLKDLGFVEWILEEQPSVLCLQETKAHRKQLIKALTNIKGYTSHFAEAQKKGYSGVVTYVHESMGKFKVKTGFDPKFDSEGRTLITEFDDFILFNAYMPNGKKNQERLDYKMDYYQQLANYVKPLQKANKNIIITGDVNTAHQEIDLARPKQNVKISGFLPEEREWQSSFLKQGFIDSYRFLQPKTVKYSWWSVRSGARARNVGWRLDYFYLSKNMKAKLKGAEIHNEIMGSDHCPISINLEF